MTLHHAPLWPSRRSFLASCAALVVAVVPDTRRSAALLSMCHGPRRRDPHPHPTPRQGITAEKVLTEAQLGPWVDALPAFDDVRQIPEIVDGIRCNCGCAETRGFYSLLSCYEGEDAMARVCHICQGQGRLAFRLHQAGKTLEEIRAAVDARFG